MPSAILHFGSEDKQVNYLKEDILEKVSSPKASLMQAFTDRYVCCHQSIFFRDEKLFKISYCA